MVKRAPVGSDEYTSDEYSPSKYVEEEESGVIDFSATTADMFNELVRYMSTRGIKAVAVPGGSWAGFELYTLSEFKVVGLEVPQSFKYWRAMKTTDDGDRLIVKDAIQRCAMIQCAGDSVDKKTQGKWLSFVESWTAYMSNENMSLAMIAKGMQSLDPYRTRTFSGTSGHFVVVPEVSWFPEKVKQVSVYDLLSILPKAEADMWMLNMGRVVCGYNNQQTAEGLLQHDYRYFCGLVGGANLGKSTLMEHYIKPALVQMGLKVTAWNLRKHNPFGWGRRAVSDWYMLSDCPTSATVDVISDPQQKILASGEALTTEEKGVGDVTIERPTAGGFMFLANGLNIPQLHVLDDDGVLDRFSCLMCKEKEELREEYGVAPGADPTALSGMTGILWEQLACDNNTTVEVLAMWLLRNCADRFLEVCGYKFDETGGLQRVEPSKLKATVKELDGKLRMSSALRAKEDLVSAIKYGVAYTMSCFRGDTYNYLRENIGELEFNHHLLLAVVRLALNINRTECPEKIQCFFPDHLAIDTIKPFFFAKEKEFKVLEYTQTPKTGFELVTLYMKTKRYLFGYPTHPVSYANLWHSALLEIPIIAQRFKEEDLAVPADMETYIHGYKEALAELMRRAPKSK